mmetsp:Transcript_1230/g.2737  ORF Transcript_1230/g.2737 Transcript_1230/m.2737 type:complete len:232 (-) Transcript_1230:439-1134(-)
MCTVWRHALLETLVVPVTHSVTTGIPGMLIFSLPQRHCLRKQSGSRLVATTKLARTWARVSSASSTGASGRAKVGAVSIPSRITCTCRTNSCFFWIPPSWWKPIKGSPLRTNSLTNRPTSMRITSTKSSAGRERPCPSAVSWLPTGRSGGLATIKTIPTIPWSPWTPPCRRPAAITCPRSPSLASLVVTSTSSSICILTMAASPALCLVTLGRLLLRLSPRPGGARSLERP